MARVEVHVPLTLRLVGRPTEADWQRLEEALVRRFARAFQTPHAVREFPAGGGAPDAAVELAMRSTER